MSGCVDVVAHPVKYIKHICKVLINIILLVIKIKLARSTISTNVDYIHIAIGKVKCTLPFKSEITIILT